MITDTVISNSTVEYTDIRHSSLIEPTFREHIYVTPDTYIHCNRHTITFDEIITKLEILDRIISQDYPEFAI